MDKKNSLEFDMAVEWRAPIWGPAIQSALERSQDRLPPGSKVLELGYGSGAMGCYLAQTYGWKIQGLEVWKERALKAQNLARKLGIQDQVDFQLVTREETIDLKGSYDAIFLKSFLFHTTTMDEYRFWISWLHQRLQDDGVLMAIENGVGHFFDRVYRQKLHREGRWWRNCLLYDSLIENEFKKVFLNYDVEYFGGMAQYFTAFPNLCRALQVGYKRFFSLHAENCFIASIVASKGPKVGQR